MNKSTKKSFIHARWWLILVVFASLSAALLTALPYGIEYGIKKGLHMLGAEVVRVTTVEFNLFTGRLAIKGVGIKRSDTFIFSLGGIEAILSWRDLLDRRILVKKLLLTDLYLLLERNSEGKILVAGLTLPTAPPKTSTKHQVATNPNPEAPWGFGISHFTLINHRIIATLPKPTAKLLLTQFSLSHLASWTPNRAANLKLSGSMDGTALEIKGTLKPFATTPNAQLAFILSGFELSPYGVLLADLLETMAGKINLDTALDIQWKGGTLAAVQEGQLALTNLALKSKKANLHRGEIVWKGKTQFKQAEDGKLEVDTKGDLNSKVENIKMPGQADLKKGGVSWKGETHIKKSVKGDIDLDVKGNLTSRVKNLKLPDQIDLNQGDISWRGQATINQNSTGKQAIDVKGTLVSKKVDVSLTKPHIFLQHKDFSWQGVTHINSGKTDTMNIQAKGTLKSGGMELDLPTQNVKIHSGQTLWTGDIQTKAPDFAGVLSTTGVLHLNDLNANAPKYGLDLLHMRDVHLDGIRVKGVNNLQLKSILLDGLDLVKPSTTNDAKEDPLLRNLNLKINTIQLKNLKDLSIEGIEQTGMVVRLVRQPSGSWERIDKVTAFLDLKPQAPPLEIVPTSEISNTVATTSSTTQDKQPTQTVPTPKRPQTQTTQTVANTSSSKVVTPLVPDTPIELPIVVQLGGYHLYDSSLYLSDEGVVPPFKTTLTIGELKIGSFDSRQPNQPVPISIKADMGKYSPIDIVGEAVPLAGRPTVNLKGIIKGIELPAISTYMVQTLGYNLGSGTLDLDVDLGLDHGVMLGSNKLRVNNLQVNPATPQQMAGQTSTITVPLETAISLLQESNGDIHLDFPISGTTDDPHFDPSDVINQALSRATAKAAILLLKTTLQPYGALLTLGEMALDAANRIRLDPLYLKPASEQVEEDAENYLGKIASLMKERTGLRIKLCGFSVEADRTMLHQQKLAHYHQNLKKLEKKQAKEAQAKSTKDTKNKRPLPKIKKPTPPSNDVLLALAKKRSELIKDSLVKKHNIAPERLFICNPELDLATDKKPRVEPSI